MARDKYNHRGTKAKLVKKVGRPINRDLTIMTPLGAVNAYGHNDEGGYFVNGHGSRPKIGDREVAKYSQLTPIILPSGNIFQNGRIPLDDKGDIIGCMLLTYQDNGMAAGYAAINRIAEFEGRGIVRQVGGTHFYFGSQ